jgi:dTDP-4-dehydrorhamnose reductase
MPRRIFIAGDRGQLAQALARVYAARGDVVQRAGRAAMDIADTAAIRSAICAFHPDLVINTAAYTAVDRAEDETEQAFKINRDGAGNAAAAAKANEAPLIHISTDYVFDGEKPTPYLETDVTNPLGVYGRSKLEGEQAVAGSADDFVILRTSWLYSADGTNFVKTILRCAGERDSINVVDDQWGAPTFAADLAGAIAVIGETLLSTKDRAAICGTYHASAAGETTWYRFARATIELSAARGGPACVIHPIAAAQFPTRARRPANSRLDGSKLQRIFGIQLPEWRTSLEHCLDQLIVARHGANA